MTKYHYCLLLMGSLLLGSCQSVEQLSIDYMLPAEVSFPATLKRVAVVNNMPNVPDNKLIISEEEQKKSENEVARLTNYYNGDAAITTESLAEALANENYFEEVVICDSALRSKDINPRESTLSRDEVLELIFTGSRNDLVYGSPHCPHQYRFRFFDGTDAPQQRGHRKM